jgi:hypothetical protein
MNEVQKATKDRSGGSDLHDPKTVSDIAHRKGPLMAENVRKPVVKKCAPALYLIITDKLFKVVLSLLLAFGVCKMAGVELSDLFDHL